MSWTIRIHAAFGSLLLPAALLFSQLRYGAMASLEPWGLAVAIAVGYGFAVTQVQRGYLQQGFTALLTLFAATAAIALGMLMPTVAETLSAKDLAQHFNQVGRLPARLWLIDDRVGSLVFYLQPAVRREVNPAQVESIGVASAAGRIAGAPSDTVVAVRERRSERFIKSLELSRSPSYQRAGEFRLYAASALRKEFAGDPKDPLAAPRGP